MKNEMIMSGENIKLDVDFSESDILLTELKSIVNNSISPYFELKDNIVYNTRGESFVLVKEGSSKEISNKQLL